VTYLKVRNKNENVRYINHLAEAMDQLVQAADCITYSSYPDINKKLIAKLDDIVDELDKCAHAFIFKP